MIRLLLSPTALSYVPVLILHLVSVGYLLLRGPRTRQTWLFCGWLGGMTLMTAAQCAACLVYVPRVSAYLAWWGGVTGVTLAMIALIQFAYHFPRLRYPREARVALIVSLLITGGLYVWMAYETLTALPLHLYAVAPSDVEAALASEKAWLSYDFRRFIFGFLAQRDASGLVSFKFFDVWQFVGNIWVLTIWLRKTVRFSEDANESPLWQRAWRALRHPQGLEAQRSRAWVLLMLLAPLPIVASTLDGMALLPPGTFATVHLLVIFAIVITYVNYAPEPTTFMVKLVGISLVTLLIILGVVSGYAMRTYREAYTQMRRAELEHVHTLIQDQRFDALPPDVLYVAARPAQGLFASEYRMVAARSGAPEAADLDAQGALRREGLLRSHFPTRYAVLHENPWLGIEGVLAIEGAAQRIDAVNIPEDAVSYWGASSYPTEHILRYTVTFQETSYEVGYSYYEYREYLHQKSLTLLALLFGTTLIILTVFPHAFQVGLVAPLRRLLQGVDRVNSGELGVVVPVTIEDEIGHLTHAFNQMVGSLRESETQLRALNLTLEQRVEDRTRDLATLYEITDLINQMGSLDDLLRAALAVTVPAVDSTAGVVLLRDEDQSQFRLAATLGLSSHLHTSLAAAPLWCHVCELGEALLVHDLAVDDRGAHLFPPELLGDSAFSCATLVGVPIPGHEACLGVLCLFGAETYLFNVENLGLLGSVAEQLGTAIENARLRERAEAAIVLEERQRLARDLHDSVTQLLYSQTLFASAATRALQTGQVEGTQQHLTHLGEAARQALREMRLLIYRLRPPVLTQVGLLGALRRRLGMVEQRAGITPHLASGLSIDLPSEMEEALYPIAEEALNNALKHAAATEIWVELRQDQQSIELSVRDNGCGFDTTRISTGLGLQSLRERAEALDGTFTIESEPGVGTRIAVRLPWRAI